MKLITIGSKLCKNMLSLSGSLSECEIIASVDGISPIMFSETDIFKLKEIFKVDYDYIVVDLFDNYNNLVISDSFKISKVERIKRIDEYIDALLKYCNESKLILVKEYKSYQFLKDDKIKNRNNIEIICKQNEFLEEEYQRIKERIPNILIIEPLKKNLDFEADNMSSTTFIPIYGKYLVECLKSIYKQKYESKHKELIISKYNKIISCYIGKLLLTNMIPDIKEKINNRRIIFIGNYNIYRNIIKELNVDISNYIEYENNIGDNEFEKNVSNYKDKSDQYLCVIPELYYKSECLSILWKNGFSITKDVVYYKTGDILLTKFEGTYHDIFNNVIQSHQKITFLLRGCGNWIATGKALRNQCTCTIAVHNQCTVVIGDNFTAHKLSIGIYDGARVEIEDKTTFAEGCRIYVAALGKVKIREDCMFSSEIVLQCGNGHALLEIGSKNQSVAKRKIIPEIILDQHVWVGYQVFILGTSHIGSGSIIGARAVVKKDFPNNCIIAGIPAKIVKKDVAWNRDPFLESLEMNSGELKKEYIKRTNL